MITTTIRSVERKGTRWIIAVDDGREPFMTKSDWKASVCQRAMERGKTVRIWGGAGWCYRELDNVREVADVVQADSRP